MFQDSACICFSRWKRQRSCTRRKLFFHSCLPVPLEACFFLLSGDECCPVQAKIHRLDFQSLVCSHPSRGRNQPSHPVSSGTLSTPHRLLFGHKTHQRHRHCQDRSYKHRWFFSSFVHVSTALANWKWKIMPLLKVDEPSLKKKILNNCSYIANKGVMYHLIKTC